MLDARLSGDGVFSDVVIFEHTASSVTDNVEQELGMGVAGIGVAVRSLHATGESVIEMRQFGNRLIDYYKAPSLAPHRSIWKRQ